MSQHSRRVWTSVLGFPILMSACAQFEPQPKPFQFGPSSNYESGRDASILENQNNPSAYAQTAADDAREACTSGDRRPCSTGCGIQSCRGSRWRTCEIATEGCNSHDDDCDGVVDEGFGVGGDCSIELENQCTTVGRLVCSDDPSVIVCAADPSRARAEVCDGVDNDCDGRSDEGFETMRCCSLDSQCGQGEICNAGRCALPDAPAQECQTISDCPQQSVCFEGQCAATCRVSSDCDDGQSCQCPSGDTCIQPICVPVNPPQMPDESGAGGDISGADPSLSCDVPVELGGFGTYTDSNVDAESVLGATCGGNGRGAERVFSFTTEVDATVFIDTSGSAFDTVLAIRTECERIESELSCDDDGGDSFQSRVEFYAQRGVRYFAIVHGFRENLRGAIRLTYGTVR